MELEKNALVWYEGEVWQYDGSKDYRGRYGLNSLQDDSLGTSALPEDIREVNKETHDAVLKWKGV